nr:hypothetical protein SHINE37_90002 [Rhizobiaceae bacterium]
MERDAEILGKDTLAKAKHLSALAYAPANLDVDRVRRLDVCCLLHRTLLIAGSQDD